VEAEAKPFGHPLVGKPYLDGEKPEISAAEHEPSFFRQAEEAPNGATKEVPWSYAQDLQDSPQEPAAVADTDEGEDAASAVGWSYEGTGRPAEPALPSDCGVECVKRKATAQAEAERLATEQKEAKDLVAVKKEHVIEDARNLKHLMSAITEEKDLLYGLPAPPPPFVKPHWPREEDDENDEDDEGNSAEKSKTVTLSAGAPAQGDASATDTASSAASTAASERRVSGSRPQALEYSAAGLRGRESRGKASRAWAAAARDGRVRREQLASISTNGLPHKVRRMRVVSGQRRSAPAGAAGTAAHVKGDEGGGSGVAPAAGGKAVGARTALTSDAWGEEVPGSEARDGVGGGLEGDFERGEQERQDIEADERVAAEERKKLYEAKILKKSVP
jgi:hypothetical protein